MLSCPCPLRGTTGSLSPFPRQYRLRVKTCKTVTSLFLLSLTTDFSSYRYQSSRRFRQSCLHVLRPAIFNKIETILQAGKQVLRLPCLLQLPATALHDVSTTSITLRNTTAEPQTFEFTIPPGSDLTLSPHVATIPAEGSLCVALRYSPRPDATPDISLQPGAASTSAAGTASDVASNGTEEQGSKVSMLPNFGGVPKRVSGD